MRAVTAQADGDLTCTKNNDKSHTIIRWLLIGNYVIDSLHARPEYAWLL